MSSMPVAYPNPKPSWLSRLRLQLPRIGRSPVVLASHAVVALVIVFALVPSVIAPYPPNKLGAGDLLASPSWSHPFGTDEFGRDILSRVIHGARIEILVSVAGVAVAVAIGVPLGLISGFRGGIADGFIMRVQDALLAVPGTLFAILIVAGFSASTSSIVFTVGIVFFPRFARLVRGSVLSLKEQEFVVASRSIGASGLRIAARHILPNCLAPIFVQITLAMAAAILIEAGLSYLGLGIQPPTATWGTMLQSAQSYASQAPWFVIAPGVWIFLLVLSLNVVGDHLRDALDPRLRNVMAARDRTTRT